MASVTRACRDNTARRRYAEGAVFPTLDFPSDHALISAVFLPRRAPPPPSRVASPRLLSATPPAAAPASLGSGSVVLTAKGPGEGVSPSGRKPRPAVFLASDLADGSSEEGATDGGGSVGASDMGSGGFESASGSGIGGGRRRRGSMNLYEYWGIADTGSAHTRLARRSDPAATAAAAALAAADWEAEVAGEGDCNEKVAAPPLRDEVAAAVEGWFVRADLDAQRVLLDRSEDSLIWIVFRCGPSSWQ